MLLWTKVATTAAAVLGIAISLEALHAARKSHLFGSRVRNALPFRLRRMRKIFTVTGVLRQLVLVLAVLGIAFVPSYLLFLLGRVSLKNPPPAIALLTLAVGTLAFWYKRKLLIAYGITEIGFGLLSAYQITGNASIQATLVTKWTVIVASVYVVSRGLNNVSDALKQYVSDKPPKPTGLSITERNAELLANQRRTAYAETPEIFISKF